MKSSPMKKWLKYLIPVFSILIALAAVISILVYYFGLISDNIESDGRHHLKEIYGQVNHSFSAFIDKNWGLLRGCNDYFAFFADSNAPSEEAEPYIKAYVDGRKEVWGFSKFYFLDKARNFVTSEGETGQLSLAASWDGVIASGRDIIASEEIGGQKFTMFAIAAQAGVYKDFSYEAIAISYTNTGIAAALNANAFDSSAKCFIISRDGSVLFTTFEGGGSYANYFTYLSNSLAAAGIGEKRQKEITTQISQDMEQILQGEAADGEGGYLQTPLGKSGDVHCIVYMPVGGGNYGDYGDYFLLSDVPQETVSKGFLSAQSATMWVMLSIFSIVGVAIIVLLVARIVNQSRRSKTELRYRERMFDVLSGSVDDIFIMLDPESERVDYLSPNVERLLGIKNETVKKSIREMAKCAVDRNIVVPKEELDAISMNGNKHWECEYMHQATGERRWYRVTIYHMDINRVKKYIVVMSDRTLEQQMNQKLQEALDAAKSANEAKSNFLSNMSHDIRTPMNAIVGFSVLLDRSADDPEKVREYTHKIMASSHHLLSLINDVLDMSKIESGKTSLNVGRFSLPELLEELGIILLPQAKAKEQEFSIHTQGTPPELLMGDKLRLNQILINLLSNAIKYTQVGGHIDFTISEVEASPQYSKLRFIVKDDGIGMSEEFQEKIFQPFSREKNSVVNSIQGTGLGMAITKNLVDLMGGIIQVESAPGKGSTFTVELSFALAEPDESGDTWYRQKITRLLVADDEEDICLNIREMMRETGVDVNYVTSGSAAVDATVRAHKEGNDFNVILLDWKMPGMDGVETARRIRKVVKDIPILVLTSYDWSEIEAEAREAGINAFMSKPFFTSTLWQTLKPLFPDSASPIPEPVAPSESVMEGRLFLVAEDNELNAEILTEMLDMEGARCELAANGKQALELFERSEAGHFDMILMDVQMPVMNGYEATKAIRACPHPDAQTIPIVAMTANTFAEDVQNAFDAGMDGHLAKPINMDAVRKTVAQLLHRNDSQENQ